MPASSRREFAVLAVLAGCGGGGLTPDIRYRMIGLPEVSGGACPATSTPAPPTFAGATSVRLTYYDAGARTLRCDAIVPLAQMGTVLSVPSPASPVDLVAEYLDASGAVLGRGETDAIDLSAGGTVDVRVAPSGAFACTPSRATVARAFHSATRLATGEVLLLGGVHEDPTTPGQFLLETRAEIYDPVAGEVRQVTIPDLTPRAFHQAYALPDGDIAVIGGLTVSGDPTTVPVAVTGTALRITAGPAAMGAPGQLLHYDTSSSTFSVAALPMDVDARAFGGLPAPGSPAIAYVGGLDLAMSGAPPRSSVDHVDPTTGSATQTLATRRPRVGASVTATSAGTLVVWGGDTTAGDGTGTAELGELLTGWDGTPASAPMTIDATSETGPQRAFAGSALAGDGALIVWGGYRMVTATALDVVTSVVQRIASPTSSAIATTLANDSVATASGYGAAITVGDGDVVMAGGNCGADLACATGEAWRYVAANGTAAKTGPLGVARYGHALTLLADGTVLASGGLDATPAAVPDLELYEPRGAADDPLQRAPGQVLQPCTIVEGGASDAGTD